MTEHSTILVTDLNNGVTIGIKTLNKQDAVFKLRKARLHYGVVNYSIEEIPHDKDTHRQTQLAAICESMVSRK